jgi:hypothetical protein
MKLHHILSLSILGISFTQVKAQIENQPHFNVKGVAIGISAPELIDLMMVTMPGLGSDAKTFVNIQSVKTYMMPPRKAGTTVGTSYTLASCLEFYSNFEKNYKANLSPDFINISLVKEPNSGIRNALKFLVTDGTISADLVPYGSIEMAKKFPDAVKFRLSNYLHIFNPLTREKSKVFEVQKALMRGNPVIVEVQVPESFDKIRNTKFWTSAGEPSAKTFSFLVVSYNLDLEAFEIQGSWGREWGSDGYLWVDFVDFGKMAQNGYVMVPQSH